MQRAPFWLACLSLFTACSLSLPMQLLSWYLAPPLSCAFFSPAYFPHASSTPPFPFPAAPECHTPRSGCRLLGLSCTCIGGCPLSSGKPPTPIGVCKSLPKTANPRLLRVRLPLMPRALRACPCHIYPHMMLRAYAATLAHDIYPTPYDAASLQALAHALYTHFPMMPRAPHACPCIYSEPLSRKMPCCWVCRSAGSHCALFRSIELLILPAVPISLPG